MAEGKRRRKNGKVDKLPQPIKDTVEQMILNSTTYREIVEYLKAEGHIMSQMAISTYARKFLDDINKLRLAQENFSMMMEELDKYPNLDTTEGIVRILSSNLFEAITSKDPSEWSSLEPDKLLRETTALIRAASYKKRNDIQNQADFDAGIDAARTLVFNTLAKERPDLYKEFNQYLSEKQSQKEETEYI